MQFYSNADEHAVFLPPGAKESFNNADINLYEGFAVENLQEDTSHADISAIRRHFYVLCGRDMEVFATRCLMFVYASLY